MLVCACCLFLFSTAGAAVALRATVCFSLRLKLCKDRNLCVPARVCVCVCVWLACVCVCVSVCLSVPLFIRLFVCFCFCCFFFFVASADLVSSIVDLVFGSWKATPEALPYFHSAVLALQSLSPLKLAPLHLAEQSEPCTCQTAQRQPGLKPSCHDTPQEYSSQRERQRSCSPTRSPTDPLTRMRGLCFGAMQYCAGCHNCQRKRAFRSG